MEWVSEIVISLELATLIILICASLSDYKSRVVSDRYWYALGLIGIAGNCIIGVVGYGFHWGYLVNLAAGAAFLYSIIGNGKPADAPMGVAAVLVSLVMVLNGNLPFWTLANCYSVLVGALYVIGYWFGIVRGGADTKCLITLGFVLPVYPQFLFNGYVPDILSSFFVPSIAILFLSSIISVVGCSVYCVARNLTEWDPVSIKGYYLPVSTAAVSHVWPLERVSSGMAQRCSIPEDDDMGEIYQEFQDARIEDVFVTPMVPFIIPITVAYVIVLLLGNPFILLC